MKKNIIVNTGLSKRGAQYAASKQRKLFMVVMGLVSIIALAIALFEPSTAGFGISLASMTLIGSIDDVSDRETHGNEMAYQVVLIATSQLADKFSFPQPDENRTVVIGKSLLKAGEAAHYFEAHAIPTLVSSAEKGDITTSGTNTLTVVMGGDRSSLKDFIEEFAGDKFIILYKHIKDTVWHIIGEAERPMVLSGTEMKDDADGRYTTLTFSRNSVYLDCLVDFDYVTGSSGTKQTINDLLTGNPAGNNG